MAPLDHSRTNGSVAAAAAIPAILPRPISPNTPTHSAASPVGHGANAWPPTNGTNGTNGVTHAPSALYGAIEQMFTEDEIALLLEEKSDEYRTKRRKASHNDLLSAPLVAPKGTSPSTRTGGECGWYPTHDELDGVTPAATSRLSMAELDSEIGHLATGGHDDERIELSEFERTLLEDPPGGAQDGGWADGSSMWPMSLFR